MWALQPLHKWQVWRPMLTEPLWLSVRVTNGAYRPASQIPEGRCLIEKVTVTFVFKHDGECRIKARRWSRQSTAKGVKKLFPMQARNQMSPRSRRRAKGDMDDLSPSHVFYLRRCVARLRILFCTHHNKKAAEESVPIRNHVLSRSNQRICIVVANSIMTSIRTCFAGATLDYPMPMLAGVLGVQPRELVPPPTSTVTKPTATVLAMNITSTAEAAPRSHVRTGWRGDCGNNLRAPWIADSSIIARHRDGYNSSQKNG